MTRPISVACFLILLIVAQAALGQRQQSQGRRVAAPQTRPNVMVPPRRGEQQGNIKPGSLASPPPPELTRVADQMTYKTVTPQQIDFVFSKRDYVVRLTDCLVHIGYCNMSFGLELYQRIEDANRGGEFCPNCTRQEVLNQLQAILRTISTYRKRYPNQWKRIEKKLLFVEDKINN